jgi:hypothetical protein
MGAHINRDGEFQSDKYPTCPAGKVPLSVKDPSAQDLLWAYAQRRRSVDAEFADDLETALRAAGFAPPTADAAGPVELRALVARLAGTLPGCEFETGQSDDGETQYCGAPAPFELEGPHDQRLGPHCARHVAAYKDGPYGHRWQATEMREATLYADVARVLGR